MNLIAIFNFGKFLQVHCLSQDYADASDQNFTLVELIQFILKLCWSYINKWNKKKIHKRIKIKAFHQDNSEHGANSLEKEN